MLAACMLSSCSTEAVPEVRYSAVMDIGTLGGSKSHANCINSSGQIAGFSETSTHGTEHAFLYDKGKMIDLGTLGGTRSRATGINELGQVVGWSDAAGGTHAFLYKDGKMLDLGTLGGDSEATAINAKGQIVGISHLGTHEHAFLYDQGKMIDLGTLGGDRSRAFGINEKGQIAGDATTKDPNNPLPQAFLFAEGKMTNIGCLSTSYVSNLGSSIGFANAYAINADGQVVGKASTRDGNPHAFSYRNGRMTDLGLLGGAISEAFAVNTSGDVVGSALDSSAETHAFIYKNGGMIDLNTLIDHDSGWVLRMACGINDSGQIVGVGIAPNGQRRAFLLGPVAQSTGSQRQ